MSNDDVLDLVQAWAAAEQRGEADGLAGLLADDFEAVGPRGFVLTKEQWLDRHRSGSLRNTSFTLRELHVRRYGDAAVVVGSQAQEATFGGHDASGTFRATLVTVRHGDRWVIAGVHLGPIVGPPG